MMKLMLKRNQTKRGKLSTGPILRMTTPDGIQLTHEREFFEVSAKEKKALLQGYIKDILNYALKESGEGNALDMVYKSFQKMNLGGTILPEDIEVFSAQFEFLDGPSKKKFVIYKLKKYFSNEFDKLYKEKKFSQEQKKVEKSKYVRQKLKETYLHCDNLHPYLPTLQEIFETKKGNELGDLYVAYILAFFYRRELRIEDVAKKIYEEIDESDTESYKELLRKSGFNETLIAKLFYEKADQGVTDNVFSDRLNNLPYVTVEDALFQIDKVYGKGLFNNNFHFLDLGIIEALNLLGEYRAKKLYKDFFYRIYMILCGDGINPIFSNVMSYRSTLLRKINEKQKIPGFYADIEEPKEKESVFFQNNVVWSLDENFNESDFTNIGLLIKEIESDFNVKTNGIFKSMDRRLSKVIGGNLEYIGFFILNSGFDDTNVLYMKDKSTGKKYLNLSLPNLNQDNYIFILTQISFYLKHKKFIDKNQLYTNIYHQYNVLKYENNELFDMNIFEEQYKELIENVVYPYSLEHIADHGHLGDAKNVLLVGYHGTGKSQAMLNLLKNKRFDYRETTFNLNANVINMNVIEFTQLLTGDVTGFKKRLSEIYDNTRIPIILIIEDLDTIIREDKDGNTDVVTQAMTMFFEGVGNVPVKVVSSTNFPQNFPMRMIRPNRLDTVIDFSLPLGDKVVEHLLQVHVNRIQLDKIVSIDMLNSFVKKMKYFTPSHVALFVDKIKKKYEFEIKFDKEFQITENLLNKIFDSLIIDVSDVEKTQNSINEWKKSITSKRENVSIGFGKNA